VQLTTGTWPRIWYFIFEILILVIKLHEKDAIPDARSNVLQRSHQRPVEPSLPILRRIADY
jgi:hypothetical protein